MHCVEQERERRYQFNKKIDEEDASSSKSQDFRNYRALLKSSTPILFTDNNIIIYRREIELMFLLLIIVIDKYKSVKENIF